MTDREAIKMALAKLEHLWEIGIGAEYKVELLPEIKVLRQALAQDEKQPVTWSTLIQEAQSIVEGKYIFKRFIDGTPFSNDIAVWMTEFALKYTTPHSAKGSADSAETFGKPEQATKCDKDPRGCWSIRCQLGKVCKNTAQTKREWVGLTDAEIDECNKLGLRDDVYKAIEAALRSKNI